MCLINVQDIPFRKGDTRWKVFKVIDGVLTSPYTPSAKWEVNTPKKSRKIANKVCFTPADAHIHVLLTKADAVAVARYISEEIAIEDVTPGTTVVIARVRTKKFKGAGDWDYYHRIGVTDRYFKSESYGEVTVVDVFTASGRHNITHRFV